MKKVYSKLLLLTLLTSATLMFSSCGSDDDGPAQLEPQEYKVEVIYSGDKDNYLKQVFIGGGVFNNVNTDLIDDLSGKTLPTYSLTDSNYNFSDHNRFALSKKVQYLHIQISASNRSITAGELKITIKVYRNGKVIDTIEDTANTDKKQISIKREYYEGDR